MTYYERAQGLIKADVRMISGCRDSQTSADVGNVSEFELPDPAGKAGGACTSALLKVLYNDGSVADDMSYVDLLHKMRDELRGDYSQIPQLSSSRPFDLKKKVEFANVEPGYTKRAVLVGINYVGQQGELSGCHNDVLNIKEYIENVHGFEEHNITVLMDDGYNTEPTRDNIMQAYNDIVSISKSGDGVFLHYSGHGGRLPDQDGDEDDGYDETLIPVDYNSTGQIRDDLLLQTLILPMAEGVNVFSLMDCCHSGTILDLPYVYRSDGDSEEFEEQPNYDFDGYASLLENVDVWCCITSCWWLLKKLM